MLFKDGTYLHKYLKHDKLTKVLRQYGKYICDERLIGHGMQVWCFKYTSSDVFKLAPTRVLKLKISELDMFKHIVPPVKILYQDKYVTCYTQKMCHPLDAKNGHFSSSYYILLCLLTFIHMVNVNRVTSDLGKHNWGIIDGKYYMYDWHPIRKRHDPTYKSVVDFLEHLNININNISQLKTIYTHLYKELSSSLIEKHDKHLKLLAHKYSL